jgi:acetyl esterase/lipase
MKMKRSSLTPKGPVGYKTNVRFYFQRGSMWVWLRLGGGSFCLTVALLALLPAPTTLLWLLAIGVTEWGYLAAPLPLLLFLPGWRFTWCGRLGAGLGLAASFLLLLTPFRAFPVAQGLPLQVAGAFGASVPRATIGAPARPAPLVLAHLVRGISSPEVRRNNRIYRNVGGQALTLDLYFPRMAEGPAPGVIVVHGGGWQTGNSGDLPELNTYLAARGYLVASINYRLAPRARFPAAREDLKAAITYLKTHAADLGLDPERLVLIGRSAGGELALLAAYTADDPAIRGVVAFYAPTDLHYSYAHPANKWVIDSRRLLEEYIGGPPRGFFAAYEAASPIRFVGSRLPPTLLIHGGRDELVSPAQSERLDARLAEAGTPHLLLRLPWATHGCDAHFNGPCGQITTYAIERFLASTMK